MSITHFRTLAIAGAFVLTACAGPDHRPEPPEAQMAAPVPGWPEVVVDEGLCPFGIPEMGPSWDDIELTFIIRDGYWLMHDDGLKTPVWVCEKMTVAHVHGPLTGRSDWCADPELCAESDGTVFCNPSTCDRGAVDDDYRGSGFDRGHLVPNMNERLDLDRKRETFYFSNAAPQVGARFNRTVWANFETELTTHVCAAEHFWTITGLLYLDEDETHRSGSLGTIGSGVEIPTHYWKLVAWLDDGGLEAFVSVMPNQDYDSDASYREHIRPIAWLEAVMNIDFMPDLDELLSEPLLMEPGQPMEFTREDCRVLCGEDANC